MTKKTLKLRSPSEQSGGPPVVARTVSPERLDRLHDMARSNKRHPTEAQKALWAKLANQKHGGFKFNRQAIVGNTLVDFACPARWLVIEIAAGTSDEFNDRKDRKLNEMGIRVMRFSEHQILSEIDMVLEATLDQLLKPFTKPQPVRRAVTRPVQFAASNDMPVEEAEPPVSDAINGLLAHCTAEELAGDAERFGATYVHIFGAPMPAAIHEAGESDDTLIYWTTEANCERRAEEGFADQAANVAIAFPLKDESEEGLAVSPEETLAEIEPAVISAELAPELAAETPSAAQSHTPIADPKETKPTDA